MHRGRFRILIFLTLFVFCGIISCGKPAKINEEVISQFLQAAKATDESEKPSQELAQKHEKVEEITKAVMKSFDEADKFREQAEAEWKDYKKTEQEASEKYAQIREGTKKKMEELQPILDSVNKQIADQEKMGQELDEAMEEAGKEIAQTRKAVEKEMARLRNEGALAPEPTPTAANDSSDFSEIVAPPDDVRKVQISDLSEKARLAYNKLGTLDPEDYDQKELEKIASELATIDDPLLTEKLLWDLYYPENEIFTKNAIIVLGKKKEKRAVSRLLELYQEEYSSVDYEEILPVALVEINDSRIVPALIKNAGETGGLLHGFNENARMALEKMGSSVVPMLLSALKGSEYYTGDLLGVLDVLKGIEDMSTVKPLLEIAKDKEIDSEIRLEALKVGTMTGTKSQFKQFKHFLAENSLFPVLDDLINCSDEYVQYDTVDYLTALEIETYEDKVLAMNKPYDNRHHMLDGIAAEYLEKYGTKKALPYLAECFLYGPKVRESAISAYGTIISRCSECIPTVEEFSKLEELLAQEGILIALQRVRQSDQPKVIPILLLGLKSDNVNIREAALTTAKRYFPNRDLNGAIADTEKKYPHKKISEKQIKDSAFKIGEALLKERQKETNLDDFQKEEIAKLKKALKKKDYNAVLNLFGYHDASMVFGYTTKEFSIEMRLAAYEILSTRFTDNWDVADFIDKIRNTANDMEELPEIRGAARQAEQSWSPSE